MGAVSSPVERVVPLPDGTALWTATSGTGPAVVFCHGGPGLWDYLGPLADLLADRVTAIRFEQRGCGRSTGTDGPFTIAQAVADLDDLRAALGIDTWHVLGHSWGAELALRYAARHPQRTRSVGYVSGVGAGDGFRPAFEAEVRRRQGDTRDRWQQLRARERTPEEEHEFCLLQWRPDFSPSSDTSAHAEALWRTRPPGTVVNARGTASSGPIAAPTTCWTLRAVCTSRLRCSAARTTRVPGRRPTPCSPPSRPPTASSSTVPGTRPGPSSRTRPG